jgi:hypothetical protein
MSVLLHKSSTKQNIYIYIYKNVGGQFAQY